MKHLYKPLMTMVLAVLVFAVSGQIPGSGLVHRYTFNSTLGNSTGSSTIAGATGNYVADRNGIPNAAHNVTSQIASAGIPNLPIGNTERTVSFWYQSNSKKDHLLFGYGAGSKWFMINYVASNETISLWNTGLDVSHPYTGQWAHIAVTHTGSLATIYINGVQSGSIAATFSIDANPTSMFGGSSGQYDYKIDDLLIYNRALTANEITSIYNDGCPTNATAPADMFICQGSSTTLTATGSDVKWYDAATGGNELAAGNTFTTPAISSTVVYYAEAASCADRVGVTVNVNICSIDVCTGLIGAYTFQNDLNDRLTGGSPFSGGTFTTDRHGEANKALLTTAGQSRTANIANLPTGSASRTISLWFKPTSHSGTLFRYGTAGARQYFGMYFNNEGKLVLQVHTNDVAISNSYITLNEWHHIALKTQGSMAYVTIDGVGRGGYGITNGFATTNSLFMIGDFNGAVDDLRVYNITTSDDADLSMYYFNNYCPIPKPVVSESSIILCEGNTLADVSITGNNIRWYSSATPSEATAVESTLALTTGGVFYATQTIAREESETIAVTIGVNTPVAPSFADIGTICAGANFTLPTSSINGIEGTWSPAINNLETTTYTFTPAEGSCAAGTASMTVTVTESVTPEFEQLDGVCVGGEILLPTTSANGITGSWTPAVDNTQTTTYTFTPDQGQGACVNTVTMTVTVYAAPYSTTPAENLTVCAGQSTTLSAFGDDLHWYDAASGGSLVGMGSTLNISRLSANTTVYVQSGSGSCKSDRTPIEITVNQGTECAIYEADVCTGMVSAFTFDGMNTDISGVSTIQQSVTYTTDRNGQNNALSLSEIDLKSAAIQNLPAGNSARAISLWLSVSNTSGGDPRVFYYGSAAAGQMFGINLNNTYTANPGQLTFIGYGPAYDQAISNSSVINPYGKWYHLVAQYDGTTVSVYLNGELKQSFARTLNTGNGNGFVIGNYNGAMDDLRIYNRTLTSDEIQNLYQINSYCSTTPQPAVSSNVTFCESEQATLSDIEVAGTDIKWYSSINTLFDEATTLVQDGATYYSTQTINGMESEPKAVTVSLTASETPVFTQLGTVCAGESFDLPSTSENGISGTWSPEINTQQTTTYTFLPDVNYCAESVTMTVEVTQKAIPEFTQVEAICTGESLSALPNTSVNGISGSWTPEINSNTTTTYTFTPADGICAESASMTIVVNEQTLPTFELAEAICVGEEGMVLPAVSMNGISGTWSPAFSNTQTTTYTFTPEAGQCASATQHTVTVQQLITPTFEAIASVCVDQEFSLPATSLENISGTWSPELNSQETTTYTFTPAAGQCATSATMTVHVNNLTVPQFTQLAPVCPGSEFSLPGVSNDGISGSWSPAPNSQQSTIYTFTPDAGQCAATTTMTVDLSGDQITPQFTQLSAVCAGESFTLPVTSIDDISGSWSPAVNNNATTTYTFTPNTGQCAIATTMTVEVINPTVPQFTQLAAVCAGDEFELPVVSNENITGTWSPAVNTATTTTYTFTPNSGQCAATTTMTVEVSSPVVPQFTQLAAVCAGDEFELPAVSVEGISGTWSPSVNSSTTTTYTFAPSAGQCAASATMTVEIITLSESVTVSNGTITASEANATYQWYNCLTESKIDGATSRSFIPAESGQYTVEISKNGCSVFSECTTVTALVLGSNTPIKSLEVYPNPAQSYLNVVLSEASQISIISLTGQQVLVSKLALGNQLINIEHLKPGIYLIKTSSGGQVKFIKE